MGYFDDYDDESVPQSNEFTYEGGQPYVPERGTTMDILHDLYVGTGEALDLLGRGIGSEGIQSVGESIGDTEFAKPDTSQYYGTQDRLGRVVDGIAQSAPLTLGLIGGTIAGGAVGGPIGAGAAFTGGMGILGSGIFDKSYEEISQERPESSEKERWDYAMTMAASEVLTEAGGQLIPFGIGKALGGSFNKIIMKSLLDSGRLSSREAINLVVKGTGPKELVTGLIGGAGSDGASEVVNELVQASARETAGLTEQPVDLIDIFLIGSAPGGIITGGTMALDSRVRSVVKKKLNDGLMAEDFTTRENTLYRIKQGLDGVDPGLGKKFYDEMLMKIADGPVDLMDEVAMKTTSMGEPIAVEDIIQDPEKIIEKAGIPTRSGQTEGTIAPGGAVGTMQTEPVEVPAEREIVTQEPQVADPSIAAGIELEMQQRVQRDAEIEIGRRVQSSVDDYMAVSRDTLPIPEKRVVQPDGTEKMVPGTIAEASVPLYDALILDNARSAAIKQGMSNVLVDSNKLAEITDLDERGALQAKIEKTQKQITKEVENHVKETRVEVPRVEEVGTVPVAKTDGPAEVVAKAPKAVAPRKPEVATEKPVVKPKVEVPKVPVELENGTWSDGTKVEEGTTTKGKLFKVIGTDGIERRAGSQKIYKKAIREGKVSELELFEQKPRSSMLDKEIPKLDKKQKDDVTSFIKNNSVSEIKGGLKVPTELVSEAVVRTAAEGKELNLENVRTTLVTLAKAMDNATDAQKMFRQGLSGATRSADELFKAEEAQTATEDTMDDVEVEDTVDLRESDNLEKADTGVAIQEGKGKATLKNITMYKDTDGTWKKIGKDKAKGLPEGTEVKTQKQTPSGDYYASEQRTKDTEGVTRVTYTIHEKDGSIAAEGLQAYELDDVLKDLTSGVKETKEKPSVVTVIRRRAEVANESLEKSEPTLETIVKDTKDSLIDIDTTKVNNDNGEAFNERFRQWGFNKVIVARANHWITKMLKDPTNRTPENAKILQGIKALRKEVNDSKDAIMGSATQVDSGSIISEVEDTIRNANQSLETDGKGTASKYKNAHELLESVISGKSILKMDKKFAELAKYLFSRANVGKLKDTKVEIGKINSYNSGTNTITLRETTDHETRLHEVVHALTVRELYNIEKKVVAGTKLSTEEARLRDTVSNLRETAMLEMQKRGLISTAELRSLAAMRTSQDFKAADGRINWGSRRQMAYGVVNNLEFLSQAFSSKDFQSLLGSIKTGKKSLLDKMLDYVMDFLGMDTKHTTALREVLAIVPDISYMDITKGVETTEALTYGDVIEADKGLKNVEGLQEAKSIAEKIEEETFHRGNLVDFLVYLRKGHENGNIGDVDSFVNAHIKKSFLEPIMTKEELDRTRDRFTRVTKRVLDGNYDITDNIQRINRSINKLTDRLNSISTRSTAREFMEANNLFSGTSKHMLTLGEIDRYFPGELDRVTMEVVDKIDGKDNILGQYLSAEHHILVRKADDHDHRRTILHEVIHAITYNRLNTDETYRNSMLDIYEDYVKNATDFGNQYGHTDLAEFVAEAMSNPKLQEQMKKIKSSRGNLLTQFKDLIKALFHGAVDNSILEEMFNVTLEGGSKITVQHESGSLEYHIAIAEMFDIDRKRIRKISKDIKAGTEVITEEQEESFYKISNLEEQMTLWGEINDKDYEYYRNVIKDSLVKTFGKEEVSAWAEHEVALVVAEGRKKILDRFEQGKYATNLERESEFPVDTEKATAEVMSGKGPKGSFKERLLEQGATIKTFAESIARPVSDIVRAYSPAIYSNLMKFESKLIMKQKEYSSKVKPFMKWYGKLSESEQVRYNFALMNSNTSKNKKIIDEIPKHLMGPLNEVLKDLRKRQEDVGLGTADGEYYFPRRVKDVKGLLEVLLKDEEFRGPIGYAFQQEAKRLGVVTLSDEQRTQVMTDMFQAGYLRQLPRPGASKERTIPFVTAETYKFYSDANDSVMGHIFEMNEKIGQREFIGGSTRKKQIRELETSFKKIKGMKEGAKRSLAIAEYDRKATRLEDLEKDLEEGVATMVYKDMGKAPAGDQLKIIDILQSRMRQRGAHGVVDMVRNIGYITTMGNFLSAITQLGDIPILFYAHGVNKDSISSVGTAFKNVWKIARNEMAGKTGETDAFVDQADFTNQLREFSQGGRSARWVEKAFQYSGLKFTDLIGKEAFMQAAYKKWQRKGQKDTFMERYEPMFGKDTQKVYQDIQLGKKTDDIMAVLISELSDFQPVTLSQQSEKYLTGGNMRVFYMLKTFTLRATSAAFREAAVDINKGGVKNIARGMAKAISILMIYSVAGAGADELKDLIRGKESSVTDNTMDNLLQMFMLSKYSLNKGMQSDNLFKTLSGELMPPIRYADSFVADVNGLINDDKEFKFKSLQSVPLIGTIAYGRSNAGQASFASQEKKSILEDVKKNKKRRKGAYSGDISKRVREYNKGVSRDEKISNDSIMRAYK